MGEQLTPEREVNARDIIKYITEPVDLYSILDEAEDDPDSIIEALDNHKHVVE